MSTYLTPGVYSERPDAAAATIDVLRTDVAAFVGYAERGPLHKPIAVQSWRQFQSEFGDFAAPGFLAYSVRGFFDNGGRRCYVVRVASRNEAVAASGSANFKPTVLAWRLEASSPGIWGNRLSVLIRATRRAQTQTLPHAHSERSASPVTSIARFEPQTLVRLTQGSVDQIAIVAEVDGPEQRLVWNKPLDTAFRLDQPISIASVEYTLTVFRDGRFAAIYEDLSLVPSHRRYAAIVLGQRSFDSSVSTRAATASPSPLVVVREVGLPTEAEDLDATAETELLLGGGCDGLANVSTEDFTGSAGDYGDLDGDGVPRLRGLIALEHIDDVSIVAVPDVHFRAVPEIRHRPVITLGVSGACYCDETSDLVNNAVAPIPSKMEQPRDFSHAEILRIQMALVAHCEKAHDRFALLDPPAEVVQSDDGISGVLAWRHRFDSSFAGMYYPWVRVADPVLGGVRDIPPCGFVAGLYARNDLRFGVHRAPANDELKNTIAPTSNVNEALQGLLNPQAINAIRAFSGRGVLLFGARTLSSDQVFRYVNVRRLLMMIEKALHLSTQWAVFEPNDFATRHKIRLAIETFLETLWRRGMLAGAQAQQAFNVRCDESNNPPAARENGQLYADISIAPSIPSEFVVLRLGRTDESTHLTVE